MKVLLSIQSHSAWLPAAKDLPHSRMNESNQLADLARAGWTVSAGGANLKLLLYTFRGHLPTI